jgi:GDPmannose 4,6-dehydratase
MKKAFITGITGQDGAYLAKLLLEKGYKIYGLVRKNSKLDFGNTDYLGITKEIEYVSGDMTDKASLSGAIRLVKPDEIYNLAGISTVEKPWEEPELVTKTNALGVLYILEAIKEFSPQSRFCQASSREMFGSSNDNGLQSEKTPFHPGSAYATAKLYAHWMTCNYRKSQGLFSSSAILFNHESPIRGPKFVTRKISSGVARIKLGLAHEIILGDLDNQRDWGFAGDYVEAMWLMLQQKKPDDYVIATGETHSVREFLQEAFAYVRLDWQKYVEIDRRYLRPTEVDCLIGDSSKARRILKWKPKINFQQLVRMMVDADMESVRTMVYGTKDKESGKKANGILAR